MVETSTSIELTDAEIREVLESQALARRGVSIREMLELYEAGRLDDPGEVADLLGLADLLRG
jgi:hypothetical protein